MIELSLASGECEFHEASGQLIYTRRLATVLLNHSAYRRQAPAPSSKSLPIGRQGGENAS